MSTQHIEDCTINGGTSLDVDCPEDPAACENAPTGEASIWNPRNILGLSPDTKTVDERLTAVEGQTLFRVNTFTYAIGTGALEIHKNGLLLAQGIEWVEQTNNTFQLATPATAGDQIIAMGHVGVTALVDVRDTDIYVSNYQAVRDYGGTETLLYAKGRVLPADGGEDFFIYLTGAAPGYYIDNDATIIVPTAGDGSAAWVRRGDLNFATLNDLVVSPSLSIGDVVETFGYLTAGDGGANVYVIRAAGTGTHDGGHFIDLTGTLFQAEGLFGSAPIEYNTRQWGALGDGVTDDTTQIQAAINFLSLSGGGTLMFPITSEGSTYRCNLSLEDNTSLLGGSRSVELIPAIDAPIIAVDPAGYPLNRLTIQLLVLNGFATKGTFTQQDGILISPNTTVIQDKIRIVECIITDCGKRGVVFSAVTADSEMREAVIHRTTIRDCVGSALVIEGDVAQTKISSSAILNSGDENSEGESNIVILAGGGVFPEDVSFDSCRIENDSYLVSGVSMYISGVLGLTLTNCGFRDFFTAIKVGNGPNGQILIQDSRFERLEAGDIEALAELVDVNGFTWTNNNVAAATTGPLGISYTGVVTALLKVDIESNNSWGNLTTSVGNLPPAILSGTSVNLSSRNGTIPISLSADGSSNLDSVLDEKGGIAQLVNGDEVILHITDLARVVTVVHGTGNIRLNAGSSFTLDGIAKIIKLSWSSYSLAWIEITRSDNLVF